MQRLSDRSLQVLNGLLNHLDRVGQFTDVLHNDSQPTIKVSEAAQALAELLRLYDEPSEPNQNNPVMPRLPYDKPPQHLMGTQKLTTVSDDVARISKLEQDARAIRNAIDENLTIATDASSRITKLEREVKSISAAFGSNINAALDRIDSVKQEVALARKDSTEANRVADEARAFAQRSDSLASLLDQRLSELFEALKVLTK